MPNLLKELVSKNKKRYQVDGFDLDLAYINCRLIAMGFPADNLEGVYRNHVDDVLRFLEQKHEKHYKIYNLCQEKVYDPSKFKGTVKWFPFEDHNPPPFEMIGDFCVDVKEWLDLHSSNVAVIHCKAGKGRTGLMICAYLIYANGFNTNSALSYYARERTKDSKGVTIPSQRRYVEYFESFLRSQLAYKPVKLRLHAIKLSTVPHISSSSYCNFIISVRHLHLAKSKNISEVFGPAKKGENDILLRSPFFQPELFRDFRIDVYNKSLLANKVNLFHFWLNTSFVFKMATRTAVKAQHELKTQHHLHSGNYNAIISNNNNHLLSSGNDADNNNNNHNHHYHGDRNGNDDSRVGYDDDAVAADVYDDDDEKNSSIHSYYDKLNKWWTSGIRGSNDATNNNNNNNNNNIINNNKNKNSNNINNITKMSDANFGSSGVPAVSNDSVSADESGENGNGTTDDATDDNVFKKERGVQKDDDGHDNDNNNKITNTTTTTTKSKNHNNNNYKNNKHNNNSKLMTALSREIISKATARQMNVQQSNKNTSNNSGQVLISYKKNDDNPLGGHGNSRSAPTTPDASPRVGLGGPKGSFGRTRCDNGCIDDAETSPGAQSDASSQQQQAHLFAGYHPTTGHFTIKTPRQSTVIDDDHTSSDQHRSSATNNHFFRTQASFKRNKSPLPSKNSEKGGDSRVGNTYLTLVLKKSELDKAVKDKQKKIFPEDFTVTLYFSESDPAHPAIAPPPPPRDSETDDSDDDDSDARYSV